MTDFTASIPIRPADAPGDAYPGPNESDWDGYLRRIANERGHRQTFTVDRVHISSETVVLATKGTEPSEWTETSKTETTIAGVKADYTSFRRSYPKLTLQKFTKITIEVRIHPHFMPPTNAEDFTHREVWFTPNGNPWTRTDIDEVRNKLTSWGAGIVISGGGSLGIEVGAELEFGHEGEDLTPPSGHPAPKPGGLRVRNEDPDVSLEDHVMRSAHNLPFASVVTDKDNLPLSTIETAAIGKVKMGSLADLDIDDIADSVSRGDYPGLARFLIQKGQPTDVAERPKNFHISNQSELFENGLLHVVKGEG